MSATIRNEMEMNIQDNIIKRSRCVATTRSCNDDYCPQMNALIVKFELLNLKADPKMEAYDAAQDRAFYEDKNYDETYDEYNEMTFGEDADTEYKFEDEDEEVRHFNEERGTKFTREQYNIFERYVEDNYLEVVDALDYIQGCHNCGKQLDIFGNDYCNKRCCEFIEDYRYPCFRGDDCIICHGYYPEVVKDNSCYWGPDCVHCAAYSGHEEDRFCLDCVECEKPMTAHEGYTIDGETWCNLCVESLDKYEDEEDNSNDSKKRKRDSDDDEEDEDEDNDSDEDSDDADDEMPTKRKCVSNETWDNWADLQNESADLWHLALEIANGDKDAAIDMLEDDDAHPTIIEYMRSKEQQDDNAMDLDISDEETVDGEIMNVDASDDEIIYNAMDLDASDDETENVDAYAEPDYDYAENVVDYDEEYVSEIPNQELYNAVVRLDDENAMLRQELEDLRNERQRRVVFPLGSSITFVDEDGIRYLQVSNINQEADNGPLSMADLEEDQEQSDQDDIENEFNMYC